MLSVRLMPLGQTASQLNCVWQRQIPECASFTLRSRASRAVSLGWRMRSRALLIAAGPKYLLFIPGMLHAAKQAPQVMQSRFPGVSRAYGEPAGMQASSVESGSRGRKAGSTLRHCSKNGSNAIAKSRITGKCGSDAKMISFASSTHRRVLHASRATPLTWRAQEPHIPTRQEKRNATVGSCCCWIANRASRTVISGAASSA